MKMRTDIACQKTNSIKNIPKIISQCHSFLVTTILFVLFITISAHGGMGKQESTISTTSHIRMQPSMILDSIGFGGPMAAATLFLPHEWTSKGGVEWNNEYLCTNGFALNWSAGTKDGLSGVVIIPARGWEWNNFGKPAFNVNCGIAMVPNVRVYLDLTLQQILPKARKTGFRPREDLRNEYAHLTGTKPTPMGQERTWVEAGEITFLTRENGVEIKGNILARVIYTQNITNSGTGIIENGSARAESGYISYAPVGAYNSSIFEAIRKSIQVDKRWEQLIAQHNAKMKNINLQGAITRHEILTKGKADAAKIRNEAWQAQQISSDKRAKDFINVLREVQPYQDKDAPGGQVEFSNTYDNVWKLEDGSYLLTNEVGFNPLQDLGLEGSLLRPE